MRQREPRMGRGTPLTPGAAEVQKRKGTGEGQQRTSQSPAALHTLAFGDFPRPQSVTRQGLPWVSERPGTTGE